MTAYYTRRTTALRLPLPYLCSIDASAIAALPPLIASRLYYRLAPVLQFTPAYPATCRSSLLPTRYYLPMQVACLHALPVFLPTRPFIVLRSPLPAHTTLRTGGHPLADTQRATVDCAPPTDSDWTFPDFPFTVGRCQLVG